MTVADGPHGLRCQANSGDHLGIKASSHATCFPTAVATGSSWDRELVAEIGAAIAEEALEYGVDTVLGPGLNIKRSPLCGRNFEYYSEDPILSGQLGAAFVNGARKNGIGTCLKHFAANSQEYKRFSSDDHIDERSLREIYFPAFEYAVRNARPAMLMCAYNKINGVYCSDNKWLLTDVLRKEWGFDGMVVTDWGAMRDRAEGFRAGCDWSMPGGGTRHLQNHALEAYKSGALTEDEINACAGRVISRALASNDARKIKKEFDRDAHHGLARKAAAQSAVLLKNEGILPLKTARIALVGHMAKYPRYQGTGSSHINPTRLSSICGAAPDWVYAEGCDAYGGTNETLLEGAVNAAKNAEAAVVVAGLPEHYESEGFDRADMKMPEGHIRLIEAVAAANANTVVVLLCGSPVETPWIDKVRALLYMGLPGQAGGEASVDILTGLANPCGKLAETWPQRYEDAPCAAYYGEPHRDAQYREGIFTGYRYYETAKAPVRFPFGFGLSYTRFAYSALAISGRAVTFTVTNTGGSAGAEVAQLYIVPPRGGIHRPAKELKAFVKLFLQPGESKTADFYLDDRGFAVWQDGWKLQTGVYGIQIASSARDIRLSSEIKIDGEDIPVPAWQADSWYAAPEGQPPKADFEKMLGRAVPEPPQPCKGCFTMENTLLELAGYSLVCKIVLRFLKKAVAKMYGVKIDPQNTTYKMAFASSADCSLFGLAINSRGSVPENMALGLVDFANGHPLRGIMRMMRKNVRKD